MKKMIGLLIAAAVLVFFVVDSGFYNMAATEKHWQITERAIAWMRDRSVETRANDLQVPALEGESMLLSGAEHYHAMCTICHLAPGLKPTELALGLYPQAPKFFEYAPVEDQNDKLARTKRYFWVIKNGLKMTAMPAWGVSHDDDSIWAMAAFALEMSAMSPEQYQEIVRAAKQQAHQHDHQEQEHEHQEPHEHQEHQGHSHDH
ncbi:MAG: cytochrome c [Nitrosomonas sp.]|nr:MAG: cytochrome c [Nitrosomonas sp.]